MANVTHVGVGAQTTGTGTTLSPALPASTAQNDLLVCIVVSRGNGESSYTFPAGWTQRGAVNQNLGPADLDLEVWYKFAGASESSPSIDNDNPGNGWSAQIAAYRNVDQTTPWVLSPTDTGTNGSSTTFQPPNISVPVNGAMALSVVATSDDNALGLSTARSFTARMSGASYDTTTGSDHSVGLADRSLTTGISNLLLPTWDQTVNGADSWNYFSDALNPATPNSIGWASWVEFEVPDPVTDGRGQVSWAEFETPNVAGRGQVSWTEFETPDVAGRGQISFTEFETPDVAGRGQVSFTEFEVPDVPARGQVSFAEFEVPNADGQGQISWAEFEVPDSPGRAQVSWTEFQVPNVVAVNGRVQISFAELQTPEVAANARPVLSWAEFEVPNVPDQAQAQISWAEFIVSDPGAGNGRAQLAFTEFEAPDPIAIMITKMSVEIPGAKRRGRVSQAYVVFPSEATPTRFEAIADKDINRELLLEELAEYGILPTLLLLPGFDPDEEQRIWSPFDSTIEREVFGEFAESGELWLEFDHVLDEEAKHSIYVVLHRHVATERTDEQIETDQAEEDLATLDALEALCPIMTEAEKDEAICLLLRMMKRFHGG